MAQLDPSFWSERCTVERLEASTKMPAGLAAMFFEDARSLVKKYASEQCVEVADGSNTAALEACLQTFSTGNHLDVTEIVDTFIERTTSRLLLHGLVSFELSRPISTTRSPSTFALSEVWTGSIWRLPIWSVQLSARDRHPFKRKVICLPSKNIWQVSIPKQLGGHQGHLDMMETLSRDRATMLPEFAFKDWGANRRSIFDYRHYQSITDSEAAYATRRWGWEARGLWASPSTNFFRIYRLLRFAYAKRQLLEHLVHEFNQLAVREGTIVGLRVPEAQVSSRFLRAMADLETGTLSFQDAIKLSYG